MKNYLTKFVWSKPTFKTVSLDSRVKDPKKLIKAVIKEVYCVDTDRLYTVVIDGEKVFDSSETWFLNGEFFKICESHYDDVIDFYNANYEKDDRAFIIALFEFIKAKYEKEFDRMFVDKIKYCLYFTKLENGGFNSIKSFLEKLKHKTLLKTIEETIKIKGVYVLTYYKELGFYTKVDFEFRKDAITMYVNDVSVEKMPCRDSIDLEQVLRRVMNLKGTIIGLL